MNEINKKVVTCTAAYIDETTNNITATAVPSINTTTTYTIGTCYSSGVGVWDWANTFPKKMPEETKTCIRNRDKNLYVGKYKNGTFETAIAVMPKIKDVKIVENQAVYVFFEDGTKERAVKSTYDTFTLEQGISICIAKKLISSICKCDSGSSIYNKLIEHCIKVYDKNRERERVEAEKEDAFMRKRKKAEEKAKRRKERQRQKEIEQQIEIQKEAYVRAMREIDGK